MYIAICDDSIKECQAVARIIDTFAGERNIPVRYRMFQDAEEMLSVAENEGFTHYILDVVMPSMDGITAAQELRSIDADAKLVFLTTFKEFAYQSYSVRAFDYLLKPVQSEKLLAVLEQLQKIEDASEECLVLPKGRSFIRISPNRLSHLEVSHKKLHFHMSDGQSWEVIGTLAKFEQELLSRGDFIKIHRSYIVNLNQISMLSPGSCIMLSGQDLPVSRLLYNQVRESYMGHLFGETGV